MAVRSVGLATALLLLVVPLAGAATLERIPAGEKARSYGIESYDVQRLSDGTELTLIAKDDAVQGKVRISWSEETGLTMALLQGARPSFSVAWDARVQKLSITDDETGGRASLIFDRRLRAWVGSEDSKRLLRAEAKRLELIANAVADARLPAAHGFPLQIHRFGKSSAPPRRWSSSVAKDAAVVSCTGTMVWSDGQLGVTASTCCSQAKNSADLNCWNSYCTGCCAYSSCNKVCALGDFYCSCDIQGQTCTQQDVSWGQGGDGGGTGGGGGGGGTPGDGGGICDEGSFVSPDVCSICGGTVVGNTCEIGGDPLID